MSKIERFQGNVQAFGSSAQGTERTIFGSTLQSDLLTDQVNVDFLRGWGIVSSNEFPTLEDFNALGYTLSQYIAYLHQAGVPEWNGIQEYQLDSYTNRNGVLYKCKTVDHTSVTPPESDTVNWELVIKPASETIAGIAETATQAETDSGADDLRFITPKKLRWGFSSSLGTTGYITLPSWLNGLIIQWGVVSVPDNGVQITAPLPITFPNNAMIAIASDQGTSSTAYPINVYALTTTEITLNSASTSSPSAAAYLAIGY